MIFFDISVNFDGSADCAAAGLRRLTVNASSLEELQVKLREMAAKDGCQFRRIFIFHDIRLTTPEKPT